MLMLLFFKYVLPIWIFFIFSKYFQPLKVVDPDHPLAALVRKAQSDNNSSTPQSADGAAVQTSPEYSSDCKCFATRQLVVCFAELSVDAGGKRICWLHASSCVFILFWSPEPLKVHSEYLLNCCLGKPGMGWRGWAGRRPSLQSVSKFSTIPLLLYYFVPADFVNSDTRKGKVKLKWVDVPLNSFQLWEFWKSLIT